MKKLLSPMLARERTDTHRAATELELLFDLVFVVAIALAAVGLHHATVEAHWTVDLIIIAICSTIVPMPDLALSMILRVKSLMASVLSERSCAPR